MAEDKIYKLIFENNESTVVAEYHPEYRTETSYQTEAELEKDFIKRLQQQGYEYLSIKNDKDLILNLRKCLETLNHITFTDEEWKHFFHSEIANPNHSIIEKTTTIQEDYIKILNRSDGSKKNIYLLDKQNIHNNKLQVINQYEAEEGQRPNRYDVTILVNGFPLVHVELKRRGVALQEAFNQINRYQRESFWSGTGLFEYIQIFVISNGTHTKYYSNTTRFQHLKEMEERKVPKGKRTSNSFEFTSWWADEKNNPIMDLMDFTKTFFTRHTFLNILMRYCVFTTDRLLLVMRPYQIVATEKILKKIEISTNYKKYGTIEAGGYIWHTTGSGKTLTSFKTAQLASRLPYIDKVLFVVDRKDLDHQTMKEYDKFEKGAANSNTNTKILKQQLQDPNARIIITTIQKLDRFIKDNKGHTIFDGHLVIIFDECHRSQFGEMHAAITKAFKKYHLFGFTGTPIFAANAPTSGPYDLRTTDQVFGERLHTYTIVDAIRDKNVLPFKVDYVSTMREAEQIENKQVPDIDKERALNDPKRIAKIVEYILLHFDQKTKRNTFYKLNDRRLAGFNSIMAVSSVEAAKKYYAEFKKQIKDLPEDKQLKIAIIYSFSTNENESDGLMDENSEDTSGLDQSSRDFLENAIRDYNAMFGTSYDTSSDKFQNYYKDVSQRMKNREIDLLIVVNMFLTGFDATTLNTLWVDKNLKMHGLLQAFSRTNRILNSVKTHGNIVCFRNLEEATNEAIALFGNKDAKSIVLIRTYQDYYEGYFDKEKNEYKPGYKTLVEELLLKFPVSKPIEKVSQQKEFIKLFGKILKQKNILSTFDQFAGNEILSERDFQDYQSMYLDFFNFYRKSSDSEKETINDDLVFEMELIKQVEINIDYILELIQKYHQDYIKNKEILDDIHKAINSSLKLRNKKDLILEFIKELDIQKSDEATQTPLDEKWKTYIIEKRKEELDKIIQEENLKKEETYKFMRNSFKRGYIESIGTEFASILPPMSRFNPNNERTKKRETVLKKIIHFFERFFDISNDSL